MALLTATGEPTPDISTMSALASALKSAESIGHVGDGHSGTVFMRTMERLGIADELKPKLRPLMGQGCGAAIVKREVQLCASPSTTPPPGVARIGYFPEEIQTYVVISVGLSAVASEPGAAASFIRFLASPEAAAVFKAKGFQPMPAR